MGAVYKALGDLTVTIRGLNSTVDRLKGEVVELKNTCSQIEPLKAEIISLRADLLQVISRNNS